MNDEMTDSEMFRAWDKQKKEKRAANRVNSEQMLLDAGLVFESKNAGAHLIVQGKKGIIDFWPGTGKYVCRGGPFGRGVRNVIALAQQK